MAGRIARAIVAERESARIMTTAALAGLIYRAVPAEYRRRKIHPATRTFQAIRIAVNQELRHLQAVLDSGIDLLTPGGRFCIIAFHSLEDRMVKAAFQAAEKGCICPPDMPLCSCHRRPRLKLLKRRPIYPGAEEMAANPRSRSARLRTAERI